MFRTSSVYYDTLSNLSMYRPSSVYYCTLSKLSMFRTSSEYDEAPVLPAVPKLIVKLGPDTPERIDSPSALPIFSPDPEHHHRHKEKKKKKKKDKKKSHEKDKDRDREHRHHKKKKKREYASVEDGYPASPTVQPPLKVLLNKLEFIQGGKIGRIGCCTN